MRYIAKELSIFNNIKFFENGHYYTINNKRIGISTTGLIHDYSQPFDSYNMAGLVAEKQGKTRKQVLDEWQKENVLSTTKGSMLHEFAQAQWLHRAYTLDYENIDPLVDKVRLRKAVEKTLPQVFAFYYESRDILEPIGDEVLIGCEEYDIAGAVDMLFKNKLTGKIVMVDFKTNKEIKRKGFKGAKMQHPLHELDDCNFVHYSLQLGVYKHLIERYTNLKIGEYYIVYFCETADNYEIIKPLILDKEVEKILNLRRANKMAKMILVMGEGGSGKTTSLRHIPADQHYYIDCDKKGLGFKGWREMYNEEKKNYIKTNDGEVVINLLKNISEKAEHIKYVTIDTINSIMIADEMKRMKGKNYNEWQDLAKCIFDIIDIDPDLRDDLTVIFMGHTQTDDDGFTRLLTNGRKLNKIGLEKYFNTVLLAKARDGEYIFETRANNSTARTPLDAFDNLEIENDITKVIEIIKEY